VKCSAQASSVDVAPPPTSSVFGAFDGDLLYEEYEAGSELWSAAAFKFRQDLSLSCRLARNQLVLYPFAPEAVAPFSVLVTFGAGLVVVVGAVGAVVTFLAVAGRRDRSLSNVDRQHKCASSLYASMLAPLCAIQQHHPLWSQIVRIWPWQH
jgi:hypothetical protein